MYHISSHSESSMDWEKISYPLVIRSHPLLLNWESHNWSVSDLQHLTLNELTNVYVSYSTYFPYFENQSYKLTDHTFKPPYNISNVCTNDFFSLTNTTYLYYSGNIMHPNFENLKKRLHPHTIVNVPMTANLWMGKFGVQSPTHYDDSFNVYIQLVGEKRFRLLPHQYNHILCMHGKYHVHSRQSRFLDLNTLENIHIVNTYTSLDNASAHSSNKHIKKLMEKCASEYEHHHVRDAYEEVVLTAGDVLYIPPYYHHEVWNGTAPIVMRG